MTRAQTMSSDCSYIMVRVEDVGSDYLYTYCCPFEDVEVGDMVVVPLGKKNTRCLGHIRAIGPHISIKHKATKWVAAHVNHRAHNMRMALGVPEITEERK